MTMPVDQIKASLTLPVFLTPAQVAKMLQVSEKTLSRWALEDGWRVVRFERERLLAWLERQEPRGARRSARSAQAPPPAA